MNEKLVQALIRFAVSGVLALIAFFVANATILNGILVDAGTDPVYAGIVVSIFVALLNSLTKFLGGATQPLTPTVGRALGEGSKRPNPFAI